MCVQPLLTWLLRLQAKAKLEANTPERLKRAFQRNQEKRKWKDNAPKNPTQWDREDMKQMVKGELEKVGCRLPSLAQTSAPQHRLHERAAV